MLRTLAIVTAVVTVHSGCSSPKPPSQSSTSAEIAALEKQIGSPGAAPRPAPAVAAPGSAPAPPLANPEFQTRAQEALQFITGQLPRGGAARDQKQFDADVAAARRLLAHLREIARSPAEQNAALLLTAMFIKDKDRHQTILIIRGSHADADIRELAAASAACRSEFDDWMKAARKEMPILELGSCLQESGAAVAFVRAGR